MTGLQPDLFDRVNARHTDPATSAAADRAFTEGGGKASQAWDVLCLVGRHPGCTAMELADFSDLDRYQIQRRISDLTRCGLVGAAVRPRACAKSKRLASTWSLTLIGRESMRHGRLLAWPPAKKPAAEAVR